MQFDLSSEIHKIEAQNTNPIKNRSNYFLNQKSPYESLKNVRDLTLTAYFREIELSKKRDEDAKARIGEQNIQNNANANKPNLTEELINQLLRIDPQNGVFSRLIRPSPDNNPNELCESFSVLLVKKQIQLDSLGNNYQKNTWKMRMNWTLN